MASSACPQLTPADEAPEDGLELDPQIAATIPFVKQSPRPSPKVNKPIVKMPSSPATRSTHLRTPIDARRSTAPTPVALRVGNGAPGSRPGSRRFSGDIELDRLSVLDIYDTGSRRPSALDILSHTGSEGAVAAVERAKERRKILIIMHRITQTLLYVLPTLIVLCLILYWTIEDGKLKWLTMVAAILGVTCVIDFILFQYFTNRVEGTDLLNTVARFRARLHKSGRRF